MRLKLLLSLAPWILFLVGVCFSLSAVGQNYLGLDKKGKVKRIHYYAGDFIRVKLMNRDQVQGRIEQVYDTSFVVEGREVKLDSVALVYSTRGGFKWIGGLMVTGGLFYLSIDMFNNLVNSRGYAISNSTVVPVSVALGVGALSLYLGTKSTKVSGKNNFKILNTTPIPIDSDALLSDTSAVDSNTNFVMATVSKLNLDGCNWVLTLANGQRLEPINLQDFMIPDDYSGSQAFQVKIRYEAIDVASICMVGPTVRLLSYEKMGPVN